MPFDPTSDAFSGTLALLHAAATFYMVGLIWFVQRVHYPLLARVGVHDFDEYERAHVARTTPVVAPPMLAEAATALLLIAFPPPGVPAIAIGAGCVLLAVIWLSTALLQVPRHRDLSAGFDAWAHRRLVATNWIRTVAWSLRGVVAWWILAALSFGSPQ